MQTNPGRLTIANQNPLVVFLIGARINKWWLLPIALPLLSKMTRMLRELAQDPESGLLGVQPLGLGVSVQYWRSTDHLERYARDNSREHRSAWQAFFKKVYRNAAIGIWHETFVVPAGNYESIYVNMPTTGMGHFKPLLNADGILNTFTARLAAPPRDSALQGAARQSAE